MQLALAICCPDSCTALHVQSPVDSLKFALPPWRPAFMRSLISCCTVNAFWFHSPRSWDVSSSGGSAAAAVAAAVAPAPAGATAPSDAGVANAAAVGSPAPCAAAGVGDGGGAGDGLRPASASGAAASCSGSCWNKTGGGDCLRFEECEHVFAVARLRCLLMQPTAVRQVKPPAPACTADDRWR